jgi:hypothetical protein
MCVCVCVCVCIYSTRGIHPSPPPEGASNLQPVLHHAGEVSAQVFDR